MEKLVEFQTFNWKNNLAALRGGARTTENPLPYNPAALLSGNRNFGLVLLCQQVHNDDVLVRFISLEQVFT